MCFANNIHIHIHSSEKLFATLCPTKGHLWPCGQKCLVARSIPQKERQPSLPCDISLILTPTQRSKEEHCFLIMAIQKQIC